MKYLHKFNENSAFDIFTNEDIFHDLLVEYKDYGIDYTTGYSLCKKMGDKYILTFNFTNRFLETSISENEIKTYILEFSFFGNLLDNKYIDSFSSTKNGYFKPSDKIYNFYEVSKDIQQRIESMGYTFLLSPNMDNIKIIILDKH
jgi:hypothetical protein